MKVILYPTVTVVAHSKFIEHPIYKVPHDADTYPLEKLGAFAAKGCYDSFGENGRPCIENQLSILEHRHGSVLEHSYVSLFIEGISRALTLEMNRHRLLNISQRSTRYTKEEDSAVVLDPYYTSIWDRFKLKWAPSTKTLVFPPVERKLEETERAEIALVSEFLDSCQRSIDAYTEQVEVLMALNPNGLEGFDLRKWARGKARNLLPHALETRVTYTANIRAWRWFIESRSNRHAEPEIRRLAGMVLNTLSGLAPFYFDDFERNEVVDGIMEYVPRYSKV